MVITNVMLKGDKQLVRKRDIKRSKISKRSQDIEKEFEK